jgi:hypothetical protein
LGVIHNRDRQLVGALGQGRSHRECGTIQRVPQRFAAFHNLCPHAAKILILIDAVRCPPKLLASNLGRIVGWFYDHLARLIYAEAVSWKPMHLAQLREYVDEQPRGHYLEGHAGEYIMPNWTVYQRESQLYVDVEAYQDDVLNWSAPRDPAQSHRSFGPYMPPALRVDYRVTHRLGAQSKLER